MNSELPGTNCAPTPEPEGIRQSEKVLVIILLVIPHSTSRDFPR